MLDDLLVREVAHRSTDVLVGLRRFAEHEPVEDVLESLGIFPHCSLSVNISRYGDEAVTNPGQIDFKTMLAVVDVELRPVVCEVRTELEEAAKTSAGR